jgi:hypothetical protein
MHPDCLNVDEPRSHSLYRDSLRRRGVKSTGTSRIYFRVLMRWGPQQSEILFSTSSDAT